MKITLERIVIVVLVLLLGYQYLVNKKSSRDMQTALTEAILSKQKSDSIVNQKDQVIKTQEVILTSNQNQLKQLTAEKFDLQKKHEKKIRSVIAYYSSRNNTGIDSVFVPYLDTTEKQKFSDSLRAVCQQVISHYEENYIKVPQRAVVDSQHFNIDLTAEKRGIKVNQIQFTDTQYIRIVEKKGGLFKKRKIEIQVLHTNPYVKIEGQSSVLYKASKKKSWVPTVLTLAGGIYLGTRL